MKFFYKLLLFVTLTLCLQYGVGNVLLPINTPPLVKEYIQQVKSSNVLYFGDSSIRTTSISDADKSPIFTFLQKEIPTMTVTGLTHDGFDAQIFSVYASTIAKEKNPPAYVIFPINLRSFSDTWYYNFSDQALYLSYLHTPLFPYLTFLENFNVPFIHSPYEFQGEDVDYGEYKGLLTNYYKKGITKTSLDEGLKESVALFYLYRLTPNHRQIKALQQSIKFLRNTKTKLVFYITPVDFDTAETYYGNTFDTIVEKNVSIISRSLKNKNVLVLDLSHALPSDSFAWRGIGYINEHVNETGRKFVAHEIAKVILKNN